MRLAPVALLAPSLVTLVATAHAGPVDPDTLRDELEDRVLDRDLDAEDLETLRLPRPGVLSGAPRASALVSLGGWVASLPGGAREVAGLVVLSFPFDRLAAPPRLVGSPATLDLGDRFGLAQSAAPAAPVTAKARSFTAAAARSCVRAAWRAAGIGDDDALDALASRARASAALPEVRLKVVRTTDDSLRLTPTDYDPYRYSQTGSTGYWLESRLTFRLDRLVFADEEVALERIPLDRADARAKLAGKVIGALFEWQRAHALEDDPSLGAQEHLAAVLRALEAEATLDVLTDGWFSRWRAESAER